MGLVSGVSKHNKPVLFANWRNRLMGLRPPQTPGSCLLIRENFFDHPLVPGREIQLKISRSRA